MVGFFFLDYVAALSRHRYYSEAHGLIFVVDAADPERLDEARAVLHQLLGHPDLSSIPLLLLANKQVFIN